MTDGLQLIETDLIPQNIPLGSLTLSAANTYTAVQVDDDLIQPDIVLNHYGKGRHAVLCWDAHEFIVKMEKMESCVNNSKFQETALRSDDSVGGTTPTSPCDPTDEEFVIKFKPQHENTEVTAIGYPHSGGIMEQIRYYKCPKVKIDGNEFGRILMKNHYWLEGLTGNYTVTANWKWSMYARRVVVPLSEVWFEKSDIEALLLGSQIAVLG